MNTRQAGVEVSEVVPFLHVTDMAGSLRFYVDGLDFKIVRHWLVDGRVRWCRLELGRAAIMLQEFSPERRLAGTVGLGVSLNFQCDDAVAFYDNVRSRGLNAEEPFVGNGLWVMSLTDPDGFQLYFSSATDVAEETLLSDVRRV
jgi:uncharacterized glyoxalase superfamily protein PhnB